jgi:glycosyltransferase involved in cell wall biosynthesis
MTGRIDPSEAPVLYAASTVVVDPIYDDDTAKARSPLKVAEGLACGVPVVTADVGDRAAMLDDGRAGLLVTPGSAVSLADGLLQVLRDPDLHSRLAEGARAASAPYRWDQLARTFMSVYES